MSERCEQTNERMSEWLITNVPILRGSESQRFLPIVRPKRVSGAAMTTDSETRTHTHTHKRTAEINELAEPQRQGIAAHTRSHTHTLTHIYTHAPPELTKKRPCIWPCLLITNKHLKIKQKIFPRSDRAFNSVQGVQNLCLSLYQSSYN